MSSVALNHALFNEQVGAWSKITSEIPLDLSDLFFTTLSSIPNCFQSPCSDIPRPTEEREQRIFDIIAGNQQRWRKTLMESEWFKKQDWVFQAIANLFYHLPISSELKNHQEFLRFRFDDLRDKVLFLSAEYDSDNRIASDEDSPLNPEMTGKLLTTLAIEFDLKYKMIQRKEEICEEVRNAVKTGKLAHVIIIGHGNPKEIGLTDSISIDSHFDFQNCFSDLDYSGSIILFSCSTGSPIGGDPLKSIAQIIATKAQRTVIAPLCLISPQPEYLRINSVIPLTFSHPVIPKYCLYHSVDPRIKNIFRVFQPQFKACHSITETDLYPIEKEAIKVIKNQLASKFLISPLAGFQETREFVRLCSDNPKKQVLVFVSEDDPKGSWHPQKMREALGIIAETKDLKYKAAKTFRDICKTVKGASNLSDVIIVADDGPSHFLISDIEKSLSDDALQKKWADCFDNLRGPGKITLFGSSSGNKQNPYSFETLAKKIAKLAIRTVVAPVPEFGTIELSQIKVSSINPLSFFHQAGESHDFLKEINAFKFFHPEYNFCSDNYSNTRSEIAGRILANPYDSWSEHYNQEMEQGLSLLQFCEDNPKDKFLFLDAEVNEYPLNRLLGRISKSFDVGYRQVFSIDDVCSEIEKTLKLGKKLAHILISAPQTVQSSLYTGYSPRNTLVSDSSNSAEVLRQGLRPDGWILSRERPYNEVIKGEKIGAFHAAFATIFGMFDDFKNAYEPAISIPEIIYPDPASVQRVTLFPDQSRLAKCFEDLNPEGKVIILDSGQTLEGKYHYNQTIGQLFSDKIKRNVITVDIADNCKNNLDVRSVEPFRLKELRNSKGCFSPSSFREFEPKK